MPNSLAVPFSPTTLPRDLAAGTVVALVALPLCLGIALASGAPLFAGLLAGIIGGIVVGAISGSATSVSGPAAGLTAVVAAQIASLGSFQAFLFALVVGGLIQIGFGAAKAGAIAAFVPSSVIKGLLAAIGVIVILKQIPHLLGHDTDPEGEMSFEQPDHETTFSEFSTLLQGQVHPGAIVVGLVSIALLVLWERTKTLKKSPVPAPLVVVLAGVAISFVLRGWGGRWAIEASHLVQIPVTTRTSELIGNLQWPDWSQWANPAVYVAGLTLALVASLETLLNLEAVDKLDVERRRLSPPNRELIAQGVGNVVAGLIGGLPVTSVIVRSSVNVNAGVRTKAATIIHGVLLLVSVVFLATYLNLIPLAALAAILVVTGFKLASPKLFRQMAREGRYQLLPFAATLLAIVFTDLLIGVLIGLGVSVMFILHSNLRRPIRQIVEKHIEGEILHIELPHQVSFLNRAGLAKILDKAPRGSHVLLDATDSDYIDPDVLSLIRDFQDEEGPAHGVKVSLRGFRQRYELKDQFQFADYSTRELAEQATAAQVIEILREGNRRFRTGQRLSRDLIRQVDGTAPGQHPLAVVLSCIDSRAPVELVFDLGVGDVFVARVAGNVVGPATLGGLEYAVIVVGVKLVVVMGHTRCGAVTSSVRLLCAEQEPAAATGCPNLPSIVDEIRHACDQSRCRALEQADPDQAQRLIDEVARQNVRHTVQTIPQRSAAIQKALDDGRVQIVGAMYDVATGEVVFLDDPAAPAQR